MIPPSDLDPWDPNNAVPAAAAAAGGPDTTATAAAAVIWRERERRQRTIRLLMMFLVMLLLMDGEDGAQRRQHAAMRKRLAHQKSKQQTAASNLLDETVFVSRRHQDERLHQLAASHARYQHLIQKNGGDNVELAIQQWAEQQAEQEKDEFADSTATRGSGSSGSSLRQREVPVSDPQAERKVFHYPWNSTGFYRGEWSRKNITTTGTGGSTSTPASTQPVAEDSKSLVPKNSKETTKDTTSSMKNVVVLEAPALEKRLLEVLRSKKHPGADASAPADPFGVVILPQGLALSMRDDNNLTSMKWESMRTDTSNALIRAIRDETTESAANRAKLNQKLSTSTTAEGGSSADNNNGSNKKEEKSSSSTTTPAITLTHDSGRAAFQLFSRSVPAMQQLSIVEGFVKLYDSTSPGYSTRKDLLLRVRGVLIHSIGRLSLVSNTVDVSRTALVIGGDGVVGRSADDDDEDTDEDANDGGDADDGSDTDAATGDRSDNNVAEEAKSRRHRRLMEALENVQHHSPSDVVVETIRDDAVALFADTVSEEDTQWSMTSPDYYHHPSDEQHRRLEEEAVEGNEKEKESAATTANPQTARRVLEATSAATGAATLSATSPTSSSAAHNGESALTDDTNDANATAQKKKIPAWSDIVLPFPFVRDNDKETVRRTKTPAARMMPSREQALEANAAGCGFEITLDVGEEEWTVGAWRKLVGRRVDELKKLDPTNNANANNNNNKDGAGSSSGAGGSDAEDEHVMHLRGTRPKPIQDQALVMTLVGTIHSANCNFTAFLNATALRTDWDATQSRAINYSFVMMLVCMTQILLLLRQLLHSQGQSAATRVSLLCIGWQTLIDALLCLEHIYLSLSIQQLFSAFASVSFFKLLIFCIIEMKYMGIIIQARNSSNGGQVTTEQLRRQIAMLHLRFYCAMAGSFLLFFYVGDKYRIFYMLALYSFWVPQIILNVVTEAKSPMHTYYIYGMSLTRLVAPFYLFGIHNNFLREVYPEAPYDPFACQMVFLWVGIQTAVLIGQSKYGARFLIPARFLPPKFDYSRPIPAGMLPPGAAEAMAAAAAVESNLMEDREDTLRGGGKKSEEEITTATSSAPASSRGRHTTAVTTRNRGKNRTANHHRSNHECNGMMTTEDHHHHHHAQGSLSSSSRTPSPTTPAPRVHTLECSICYEGIDVCKRHDYMLAPCNHLFHRECLVQWMDVKMECPICRMELPAL